MKIKQRRERRTSTEHRFEFEWNDNPGGGFSFPCDEHGNVDVGGLNETALENYRKCVSGELDVHSKGLVSWTNSWTEPAIGICNRCGSDVVLSGFTNTCSCGADYNMSGQELAPRSQWGWETGESVSEILSVDHTPLEDFDF